jgi:hypothetical protein
MSSNAQGPALHKTRGQLPMDPLPDDKGSDTQGGKYTSIQDLWVNELGKPGEEEQKEVTWYPKAGRCFVAFFLFK